jgi:dinuclear metal center YbgI/SA1388 family protein
MEPQVTDIVEIIDKIAPFGFAEEWDNSGLQVGDPTARVSRIMVSLDAGWEAIEAAISKRCQLLLTHHPLIFRPSKIINVADPSGHLIKLALKNDLSIVSLHTNYDIADKGINDLLAERIGLKSCIPLSLTGFEELIKLVVFVPRGHEEKVVESLFQFSGFIGNYSDCSFQSPGTGTFKPLAGADPFIGKVGSREYAEETRIEVLLRKADMPIALEAMVSAHPYEEPAYDLYPLINKGRNRGLGRVGELEKGLALEALAASIKKEFSLGGLRIVGDGARIVKRVAVCGGSGASFVRDAVRQGADVLITGDAKYHDAKDAQMLGLALVDMGHFASETVMIKGIVSALTSELAEKGFTVEVLSCETEKDPFVFL